MPLDGKGGLRVGNGEEEHVEEYALALTMKALDSCMELSHLIN
jgi:hypothetical protein